MCKPVLTNVYDDDDDDDDDDNNLPWYIKLVTVKSLHGEHILLFNNSTKSCIAEISTKVTRGYFLCSPGISRSRVAYAL